MVEVVVAREKIKENGGNQKEIRELNQDNN
jgi:hypothetical protein